MPAPDSISQDLKIGIFGGRVSQFDPQSLPKGASPFNEDVSYSGIDPAGVPIVGGVATRPGNAAFYANPFAGNPTVNYMAPFEDSQTIRHLLSLDNNGNVYDESPCPNPPGVPSIIGVVTAACYAQSDSLFGREYMAFSDTRFGLDIPRGYDGSHFDRISQCGPGEAPTANDTAYVSTIAAAPLGLTPFTFVITFISQVGNAVVVKGAQDMTSASMGDIWSVAGNADGYDGNYTYRKRISADTFLMEPVAVLGALPVSAGGTLNTNQITVTPILANSLTGAVGMLIIIAGATDATYDGTFEIRQRTGSDLVSTTMRFYNPGTSGVASGGGTITLLGHVTAGLHLVTVSFVTRSLYVTKPAPFGSFLASGGRVATLTDIPIGPANVIARIVMFSKAVPSMAANSIYYLGADVPAGDLAPPPAQQHLIYPSMVIPNNTDITALFDFDDVTLAASTDATYLYRLLELGECASCCTYSSRTFWAGERNKLQNLVNASFDGGFNLSSSRPLGWDYDPSVSGSGGGGKESVNVVWGDAYKITGDGVNAIRGLITQTVYRDFLGIPILSPNTAYSYRVRLRKTAGAIQGNFVMESPHTVITIPVANMSATGYTEFIGVFMGAQSVINITDIMKVYSSGTLTNGESIYVENIEIFPTLQPYNLNVVRCSYASDPESIDGTTGLLIPGDSSTISIRCLFKLLDNKLYMVTDAGIYVTQDDGANEPYKWSINTVSSVVGVQSVRGSDDAESWAIIAHTDGAYIFWGSEVVKISQEIQPDWDTINWQFGSKMYVLIDNIHKRIHIGAPTGASQICNKEFVCDYSQLSSDNGVITAESIASSAQVGPDLTAPSRARKWSIWNLSMNCAALVNRSDGSIILLRGNGTGTGKVYKQDTAATSDDGVAIHSPYQTYYFPQDEETSFNHRYQCKYLTGYVSGSGTLHITIFGQQEFLSVTLSDTPLTSPTKWDFEKNVNFVSEGMSLLLETNGVGEWFHLTKLCPVIQPEIISPVKGTV